ncbi:MAG: molybdenum cofactor biosynthesis protein B [Myxococcota bacterium]
MAERRALRIAVLTISDTRTEETDRSGATLAERLQASGHVLADKRIVKDEPGAIRDAVTAWCEDAEVEVVIATGGTGITGRDVTPEVFEGLYDKPIPGFGELFRWLSYREIGTATIQSRATAGIAGGTLLFALPGSTGACRTAWDEILVFQLDSTHPPCNFAEMMDRLVE